MISHQRSDWKKSCLTLTLCFVLGRCASKPTAIEQPKVPGVLGEVKQETDQPKSSESLAGTSEKNLLANLNEQLKSLGYEALGLQFESDETLLLLGKIFDSPVSHNRQIRIIYTGLEMSYDAKHESLTIGGRKDLKSILNYIQKNIPLKSLNETSKSVPTEAVAPISPKGTKQSKKTKVKKSPVKLNKKVLKNGSKKTPPSPTTVPPSTVPLNTAPSSTLSPSTTAPKTTLPPEPQVTEPQTIEPVENPPSENPQTAPDEAVSPDSAEPENTPAPEGPADEVMKPTPL